MDWVWSMWGWIWPASFNENKFKVDLKTGIIRTNLHKLKLQEQLQRAKSDILEVVRSGKIEMARIKVEALIQDYRKLHAYDIIVHYCETMLTRIELLQVTGDTPSEVLSSIHTIAYAAANLNIPELNEISAQLKAKYGYNIGNILVESAAIWIDKKVIESLSTAPPSEEVINKYMEEFYGKAESSDVKFPVFSLAKSDPASLTQATEPLAQTYYQSQSAQYTQPSPSPSPSPYTPPPFQFPLASTPPPSAPAHSPPAPHTLYPSLSTPTAFPPYPAFTPPPFSPSSTSPSPSPSPSPSSSYVDPSLLYSSPCTTYASAPFISPPPENPEFTAHEASRAHILKMASAAARKKRTSPDSSPSPKKKSAHGGVRKKKRVGKIKKRKSNPFQQAPEISPIKQEEEHYDSSDEEFMETYNEKANKNKQTQEDKSESEESSLDLSARLEALKRTN